MVGCVLLHLVSLSGTTLPPMLVLKRKTLDAELVLNGYGDKAVYVHSPSGYINSELYVKWFSDVLVPYLTKEKTRIGYTGHAVLIVDGCSAHMSSNVRVLASEHNATIVNIPPHSSHLLQPLDLGIFGVQKCAYSKLHISKKNFTEQSIQNIRLATKFQEIIFMQFLKLR